MTTTRRTKPIRLAVATAAALTFALTACGDDGSTPVAADPTTTTSTTVAPPHDGPIDVVAEDFRFVGLPERVTAGTHTVTFENRGEETHELFVFRNPKGLTLEEIAAIGPSVVNGDVELVTLKILAPGAPAESVEVDLTPGEYFVACFIPTPTDDRAHFEHGMQATFTVVDR